MSTIIVAQIKKFQNRFWTTCLPAGRKSALGGLYRFTSAYGGKKKIGNEFSIHFAFGKSNFQISDRTLFFDFKNAWKILANRNAEAQGAEASKAEISENKIWLRLLNEIRTFFDENPDSDF